MRIIQIIASIGIRSGGPSVTALRMAEHFSSMGFDSEILTLADGELTFPIAKCESAGVNIRTFPYFPPQIIGYSRPLQKYFAKVTSKVDLVIIHSSIYKLFVRDVAAICRKNGTPYIFLAHGCLDPAVREKHRFRNKLLDALYFDRVISGASGCHFTSDREADRAEKKSQCRQIILPCGCDAIDQPDDLIFRRTFNIPKDKYLFLYLSRITKKKGIDILLPSAISMLERGFDFYLALCGPIDPDLEQSIRSAQQKAKGRIVVTGLVDRTMGACAFYESDCFVLPTYSENFGVAVFEAISTDLKTITTTGLDFHEKLEGCPIVTIIPPERAALENAMCSTLQQGQTTRSGAGKAWMIEHYSFINAINKITNEYISIARKNSQAV